VEDLANLNMKEILDSLGDGVYVCDLDRKIIYWNKSAERITGWRSEDVVGKECFDNVLCHIDKDGHLLCGEEYCPLHRSIVTGSGSKGSLLVYAQGKNGRRVPMQVAVAPLRDDAGRVIGGVETFRDASDMVHDLERAKAIQQVALQHDLPDDPRVAFATHYVPHAIVGGDYYAIQKLADDQYGLMLADVMGHGIAAALYTMHLSQLWERYHKLLTSPAEFTAKVNHELAKVVKTDESFATAVCAHIDLQDKTLRFAGAGGPQVLLMHADGTHECLESSGLPLAVLEDAAYEEIGIEIQKGDSLLLVSDGAVEIHNADGQMLDMEGLLTIVKQRRDPECGIDMNGIEEDLLKYSNAIRLEDDLTLVEVRFLD
jgi:PAS domain S-box-containing protein